MGETIEFPDKLERLFILGKQAFDAEDFLKALNYFTESYQHQPTIELNQYIVQTHLTLGQPKESFQYIKEFEKVYQKEVILQPLYFDTLLKLKLFLTIHKWLNQLEDDSVKESFNQSLETAEQFWITVDNQEYLKRRINFENLSENFVADQVMAMKEINYLTKYDFLEIVKGLLCSNHLSPLIRAQLIDELIQLKEETEITTLDVYGEEQRLNLATVSRLSQTILSHPLYLALSDYIENNEPSQEKLVMGVLKTHLGMSYPFLNKMTEDIDSWKLAYLLYFGLIENEELMSKHNILKRYDEIKKLDNIMMNTMTKL